MMTLSGMPSTLRIQSTNGLDILTERGQQTVRDEHRAVSIWLRHFPELHYIETAKDKPAVIDALLIKNNRIEAGVETKCRYDMTLRSFRVERDSRWLITHEKLEKARVLCSQMGVPLYGFLYIVQDNVLMFKEIANDLGEYVADIRVENTETQKTVNGGKIVRANAFIDMADAKVLR